MPKPRLAGTNSFRSASSAACSDTARWYWQFSWARRRMPAGRPTVEIVIRRTLMPRPSRLGGRGQGRQQGVEVQQRLAHAHHHDVAEPLRGEKGVRTIFCGGAILRRVGGEK